MSFSSRIKEELQEQIPSSRHCQLAELAAMTVCCGSIVKEGDADRLTVNTENEFVARKYFTLAGKSLKVVFGVSTRAQSRSLTTETLEGQEALISALKLDNPIGKRVDSRLYKGSCCKRACLRGYFLCCGSMSRPETGYHLEMALQSTETADQIIELMKAFSLEAKRVLRKKYHVVYLKDGEAIADFLKVIEAPRALMEFENTRIYKDMRSRVNRKVNCEAANISKTVTAAARQVEDIRLIDRMKGIDSLTPRLRQMAYLRLEEPEASLEELGKMFQPAIGKSGVNHRLRKLSEIAEELRQG